MPNPLPITVQSNMRLVDFVNYVCAMVNATEPEDLAACRTFVQQRFKMIWQSQLWKDSLFEYTQPLPLSGYTSSSTWLPDSKILLIPPRVTQVVAARLADNRLRVEFSPQFYRADFDQFTNTGSPMEYRLLSPVVWETDTEQNLSLVSGVDPSPATVDFLDPNTLDVDRVVFPTVVGKPVIFAGEIRDIIKLLTVQGSSPPSGGASGLLLEGGGHLQLEGGGNVLLESPQGSAGATVTSYTVSLVDPATNVTILTVPADAVRALRRQRLQLFGSVPANAVIRVLGKVVCPNFTDDSDEPGLTGVENCLLAFAQADMLKRSRQYGKAQVEMQEGIQLLAQLVAEQVVQQAHSVRFTPETGYADEWSMGSGLYSVVQ